MSLSSFSSTQSDASVLDIVEQVLDAADWVHERETVDSLHCIAPTRWGELGGVFAHREDPPAVHFSMTLDVKPMPTRRAELCDLIARINERLWLGHFDYWADENLIMFRHAIPMLDRVEPTGGEVAAIVSAASEAIDQFIPAMNFVIWAGKSASEAVEAALFATVGEA